MRKYRKLLNKVVTKIDRWHHKVTEKRKGRFERDEDFIESSPSPSRFSSSSSEEAKTSRGKTKGSSKSKEKSANFDIHQSRISGSDGKTQDSSPFGGKKKELISVDLSPVHAIKESEDNFSEMTERLETIEKKKVVRVKRKRSRTTLIKPVGTFTNNKSNSGSREPPK
jgi:hypothetical protein